MYFPPKVKDICSSSVECRTAPLRQLSQSSLPLHRNSYMLSTFCTEHNVQECLSHINQVGNLTCVFGVLLAQLLIRKCLFLVDMYNRTALSWVSVWLVLHILCLTLFSSFTLSFSGGVIYWPPTSLDGVGRQLRNECCGCAELHVWPDSAAPQGPPNPGKHGNGAAEVQQQCGLPAAHQLPT